FGDAGSHSGNHRAGADASTAIYRIPLRVRTRRSEATHCGRGVTTVAQASCLWGNRASRLVDTFSPSGKMPAAPTIEDGCATRPSGNAGRTMPCVRRSSLISASLYTEDTFHLFPDAAEATILAFCSHQPWTRSLFLRCNAWRGRVFRGLCFRGATFLSRDACARGKELRPRKYCQYPR